MRTVTIGWLEDNIGYVGGAEMSGAALRRGKPGWVEDIIMCPPNKRPPTDDITCWVVQNCVSYKSRWVEELALKPVIRQFRDPNYAGSALLRRWLLENSELLLFSSPLQAHAFEYVTELPAKVVPPPVDLVPFRAAALPDEEREGNVFVGRADVFKGAHAVVDWAIRENEPLDLYGPRGFGGGNFLDFGKLPPFISFHGQVPYERMPFILGAAKRFVFFPSWVEAFGRVVVEAWAAGCELLLRENRVGAQWWIENDPDALERGVEMFWDAIEGVIA